MTTISPAQEKRLAEITTDFKLALGIPAAMFSGEQGREKQLQRLANDMCAVFGEAPATFAGDASQAREAVMNRYLSATAAGREVLKRKGITSNNGTVRTIDVLRARGDITRQAMVDKCLAATPDGRAALKARESKR
jgi:hypothetical protein